MDAAVSPDLDGRGSGPVRGYPMTTVLALAAVGASVISLVGEKSAFSLLTALGTLAGLVPWALVTGGVRVPPWPFIAMSLGATAVVVVVDRNPGGMFIAMVTVVWIGRTTGLGRHLAVTVAVSAGLIVWLAILIGTAHEAGVFYFVGGIGISALAGVMLGRQEQMAAELAAVQELRIEHAAAAERARIAREVHDVVAHSLTVVMLHVAGARRALDSDPVGAAGALERAETVGRESLDSIRQIVGLLRDDPRRSDPPGPAGRSLVVDAVSFVGLEQLVEGYRAAGVEVAVELAADPAEVDAPTQLVAYRIVQGALSNAARHAPGSACRVTVAVRPVDLRRVDARPADGDVGGDRTGGDRTGGDRTGGDWTGGGDRQVHGRVVAVEVVNGPATGRAATTDPARTGLGIRGMTERVRAAGGVIETGPTADGGWRVAAELPCRRWAPATATPTTVTTAGTTEAS